MTLLLLGFPSKLTYLFNYIKPTGPTYFLQSLRGQPYGTHFLILLLKTARRPGSLISLGIAFHILVQVFAIDPILKWVEWMFDQGNYHSFTHKQSFLKNQTFCS